MRKILIYTLSIFFTLSACKDKNAQEDKVNYHEVLEEVEGEKNNSKQIDNDNENLCDINFLNELNNNIEKINYLKIELFLLSFNDSCKNNIEYSEYRNEILFNLLNKQTSQVIDVLVKNKKVSKIAILEEVSNPISDKIDLDEIIEKTEHINSQSNIKKEILKALKNAKN